MARKITPLKARRIYKGRLLFGMVLNPLRLFCSHCDKYVPSDMEWLCGYCNEHNIATRIYSFLNKCKTCKRPAKSFVCPHCGKINYLDKDGSGSHPASKISVPIPPETREEIRSRKKEEREDNKEGLEHDITVAKLNAELAKIKAEAEPKKKSTPFDALEEDFSERATVMLGAHQIADREYKKNKEKYKNNPGLLEQADDFVKSWVEDQAKS